MTEEQNRGAGGGGEPCELPRTSPEIVVLGPLVPGRVVVLQLVADGVARIGRYL